MAAYVDFQFYEKEYGGVAIPEINFDVYARRASVMVSYLAFNRTNEIIEKDEDADLVEAIKFATCAVAEEMLEIDSSPQQIRREQVGSHSVSYAQTSHQMLPNQQRYLLAAKQYLVRTGLLYRGFRAGEYRGVVSAN